MSTTCLSKNYIFIVVFIISSSTVLFHWHLPLPHPLHLLSLSGFSCPHNQHSHSPRHRSHCLHEGSWLWSSLKHNRIQLKNIFVLKLQILCHDVYRLWAGTRHFLFQFNNKTIRNSNRIPEMTEETSGNRDTERDNIWSVRTASFKNCLFTENNLCKNIAFSRRLIFPSKGSAETEQLILMYWPQVILLAALIEMLDVERPVVKAAQ